MTRSTFAIALLAGAFAMNAAAQQPPAAIGGAVVASEPGKATIASAAEMSAQVVGIDKATRTVTLKGPKGNTMDVVAGEQVKIFDQIAVGDTVSVRYLEWLELRLLKGQQAPDRHRDLLPASPAPAAVFR